MTYEVIHEASEDFDLTSCPSPITAMVDHFSEIHMMLKRHDERFQLRKDPWFDRPEPFRWSFFQGLVQAGPTKDLIIARPKSFRAVASGPSGILNDGLILSVRPAERNGQFMFLLASALEPHAFFHVDEMLQAKLKSIRAFGRFRRCVSD